MKAPAPATERAGFDDHDFLLEGGADGTPASAEDNVNAVHITPTVPAAEKQPVVDGSKPTMAEGKNVKQMLNELNSTLDNPIVTGIEHMWRWSVFDEGGNVIFEKTLACCDCKKEKKVRDRFESSFTPAENELVKEMYTTHVQKKMKTKTDQEMSGEMRVFIEDRVQVVYMKVHADSFFDLMGDMFKTYADLDTFAVDVEGPADDPVFLQIAFETNAPHPVYHALLVVFSSNEDLFRFQENFKTMMAGKTVVAWGASQGSFEANIATIDAQTNKVRAQHPLFVWHFTLFAHRCLSSRRSRTWWKSRLRRTSRCRGRTSRSGATRSG